MDDWLEPELLRGAAPRNILAASNHLIGRRMARTMAVWLKRDARVHMMLEFLRRGVSSGGFTQNHQRSSQPSGNSPTLSWRSSLHTVRSKSGMLGIDLATTTGILRLIHSSPDFNSAHAVTRMHVNEVAGEGEESHVQTVSSWRVGCWT